MMRCLTEPRDQKFVKNYGFLFSAKNMSQNFGKNTIKTFLDHTKQLATDVFKKTLKREIPKSSSRSSW